MRITRLQLAPYGHLVDAGLDLTAPSGGAGLHVIRGRNGAGKSTTMRALNGALFGIQRNTPDMHTHPGAALRIGLSLRSRDGRVLSVERHKRDGQSLFAPDGSPVDEAVLRETLGGLPPEEYRAMFLLDCEKLEQGSEELLAGRGLLGQALFGAALGFGRVHTILAELDAEAQALWVKGGTRPLTQQLKQLDEVRRQKRQVRLHPDELARLRRELDDVQREFTELRQTQRVVAERLQRTTRHQRCLPPLVQRTQLLDQLHQLPATPALPVTFADEVRAASGDLASAESRIAELEDELGGVKEQLDANPDPGPIASRETVINALYRRAGESAKAASDLPRREAELTRQRAELARLLRAAALPHDADVDRLRISDANRARVAELATERARLGQAQESAKQALAKLERRVKELNQSAPVSPASLPSQVYEALRDATEAACATGDLDTSLAEARERASEQRNEAERAAAALPLWDGDIEELERLAVPGTATIQRFEHEQTELELAAQRLADRQQDLDARASDLDRQDRAVVGGPISPTRGELTEARGRRDRALTVLIDTPSAQQGAAVRESIRHSDQLADARADHAELAAARERLESDRAILVKDRKRLQDDCSAHEQLKREFAQSWAAQWPGLHSPLPPREMREWLSARDDVLAIARAAAQEETGAQRAEQAIVQHRNALRAFFTGKNDDQPSLSMIIRQARSLLADADAARATAAQHERDASRLKDEIAEARDQVAQAEEALAQWGESWAPLVAALGLSPDASAGQARAQTKAIDDLVAAFDDVSELERRISRLQADQAGFASATRELATELAPEIGDTEPLQIAEELHARAAAARIVMATREQLQPRRQKLSQALTAAQAKRSGALHRIGALARQAEVAREGLAALCETVEERHALVDELHGVERELVAAGGATVEVLTAELADATPEDLAAAEAEDEAEASRLEARRDELNRREAELAVKLGGCGEEAAALTAEAEAHARAAVLDAYERYTELTFAAGLLRVAIDRYRKQNEGPLLRRAGELFARLSGGTMAKLSVLTTEKNPYIMGVRPDGREVPVKGMSAGQRHQLFLALRLASLERHFERNEPMPLILDDLLVQLDDISARAALEILAELSRTVQVLFFTHHDHLIAMARDSVPPELLVEHEIGQATRPALRAA